MANRHSQNHGEHISVQDAVSCLTCNPRKLDIRDYRAILDNGGDPSTDLPPMRFRVGDQVVIKPMSTSQSLRGEVKHIYWQDSFNEYAYTVTLRSGETSTAWERQLWKEVRS